MNCWERERMLGQMLLVDKKVRNRTSTDVASREECIWCDTVARMREIKDMRIEEKVAHTS